MLTTLTQKVIAVMVVIWLLLAFLAINAYMTLQQNRRALSYISDHTIVLTRARNEFVLNMYQAIQRTREYIINGDDDARIAAFDALEQADTIMRDVIYPLDQEDRSIIGLDLIPVSETNAGTQIVLDLNLTITQAIRNSEQNPEQNIEQLQLLQETEAKLNAYVQSTEKLINEEIVAARSATAQAARRGLIVMPLTFTGLLIGSFILLWAIRRFILNPIRDLSSATAAVAAGDLNQRMPENRRDELGSLQRSFNIMVTDLQQQREELQTRALELETTLDEQNRLFSTIKELSTPLLPIIPGVVVLPIVGHVDQQRADELTDALLEGVAQRRARIVILDVTGIPLMDTQVVNLLLQAAYATQLLGARVWFAGISPLLAQTLVEQDVELEDLKTFRDLSAATSAALRLL